MRSMLLFPLAVLGVMALGAYVGIATLVTMICKYNGSPFSEAFSTGFTWPHLLWDLLIYVIKAFRR